MTEPIRVLIADDHPLFRDGLTALLTDGTDTELTGAAASGTEAVEMARETQPDVVIMDLHMPGLNGIEATRRIVADSPHIKVLVLTMFDDDDSIFSALRAGARGYLLKGADQEQIRAAVQAAANGEIIFGTQLAARMLAYFTTPASALRQRGADRRGGHRARPAVHAGSRVRRRRRGGDRRGPGECLAPVRPDPGQLRERMARL